MLFWNSLRAFTTLRLLLCVYYTAFSALTARCLHGGRRVILLSTQKAFSRKAVAQSLILLFAFYRKAAASKNSNRRC